MSLRSFIQGPAPIERAVLRAVDRAKQQLISSIYAPNRCTVRLAESHHHRAQPLLPILRGELTEILMEHIAKRGWKLVTPELHLEIVADTDLRDGQIEVDCDFVEGEGAVPDHDHATSPLARESSPSGFWLLQENGSRVPLWPLPFTVGREECDLILPDAHRRLSRRHCQIVAACDGLEVVDLGSTNGTFVDGQVAEHMALVPGSRLEVGGHTLTVIADAEEDSPRDSLAL